MTSPDAAVIPCGGLGTRMQPITGWLPKELLPVSLSPLIHWPLAEAAGLVVSAGAYCGRRVVRLTVAQNQEPGVEATLEVVRAEVREAWYGSGPGGG